jgi:hypothetical protein
MGMMTCITSVGLWKVYTVHDVYAALQAERGESERANYDRLEGSQWVSEAVMVISHPLDGHCAQTRSLHKAFDGLRSLPRRARPPAILEPAISLQHRRSL